MMSEPELDAVVRFFAAFLRDSWPRVAHLSESVETGSYLQDWVQANWEALVEGAIGTGDVFIEVYGEGADCNARSSRVYRPDAVATHAIVCVARHGRTHVHDLLNRESFELGEREIPVEEFVTMDGDWYSRRPPFDCVLVDDAGRERVLSIEAIRFSLGRATRG